MGLDPLGMGHAIFTGNGAVMIEELKNPAFRHAMIGIQTGPDGQPILPTKRSTSQALSHWQVALRGASMYTDHETTFGREFRILYLALNPSASCLQPTSLRSHYLSFSLAGTEKLTIGKLWQIVDIICYN